MNIRRKMVLIVTASILLTAVPGAALIYGYAQRNILASESAKLAQTTARFVGFAMQRFAQGEPKLASLARILEKELAQAVQPGEIEAFHRIMERNQDGVWRNRKPGYDGKNEAGIFLPPNAEESNQQKVWHLRIKRVMDHFGAAASKPMENVWYLSLHRSEIIFDRTFPDFAFDQKADNDYTQTPWLTYTSPKLNPGRQFRFTPPLFDPVPKVWMVSALYPLYVNGEWIGSLGEDMQLTSVLEAMFANGQTYDGVHHFLLDKQGNFVLAGPWQKELESSTKAFRPDLSQEPQLAALIKSLLTGTPSSLGDDVVVQGKRYLAIGMQLEPLDWRYFSLTPVDAILASTRVLFIALGGMILLVTVLSGVMIGAATNSSITRRILILRNTMREYARNHDRRISARLIGDDEIGEAALVYNQMADDIDRNIAERLDVEDSLRRSEELWRFALEGAGDGVWDWNVADSTVFFSRRWKAMLGFDENEIGNGLHEWEMRIHPEDKAETLATVQAYFDGKIPVYASEHRVRCKDGSWKWMLDRGMVVSRNVEGEPLRMIGTHTDITERKQAEARLFESEVRHRTYIESAPDGIFIADANGRYLDVNPAACALVGYSREELLGMGIADLAPPEALSEHLELFEEIRRRDGLSSELVLRCKNGSGIFVALKSVILPDWRIMGFCSDITERKQAEKKLHLAASVFTHAREGIMITGADSRIVEVNDAFVDITGYRREDVLGKKPGLLNSGHQNKEFYAAMWRELIEKGEWSGELWNRRKNGEVYAQQQTISAVRDSNGNTQQYVALFSDITAFKEHERELVRIAHYDALTTLPNRVLLADRLHQAMTQNQRRGHGLAVAYLDLDGFKAINDCYGHEVGDQLLMSLAARMKQALREVDTLARLGGDEFVAVLLDLTDVEASVPLFTRLLAAAAEPVYIGDFVLQVSASVGVTFYPQADDVDADQLLRQADQAMYHAKLAGKNRYYVFDAEQDRNVRGHHESLERIRRALTEREFVLYYQPKVNMRTGIVIGAEALIRWEHPEKGLLPPATFLPVIENHALAVEIGEWVIDTALTQMERWQTVGLDIPVSVNVGARQLQQPDFVERLCDMLLAHPQVKPCCLEMEVLETSALEDLARISEVIEICRQIGVMFALDDFGTGYSSLTYLKSLPVKLLKIDQSFVRDMLDDPDDLAILEGVLGLSTAFRREVIAEGVETVEHGEMLLQLGCELAQGYGIARPMPANDLPDWAAAWCPDAAWKNRASVSRDDLPPLFAVVEHRAWIAALQNYFNGERAAPPSLDSHQCRFGTWLDAGGLAGRDAQLAAIKPLHNQVHALAAELCEQKHRSLEPEASVRLDGLHNLHDALLEQLKALVQRNPL